MENNYCINGIEDILNNMSYKTQATPTIPTGRPTIPTGNTCQNLLSPMPQTQANPFEVTTGENTLWGFNALSIPRTENGKSYYILCCIIDKSDPSVQELQNAITVAQNAGRKKFGQNLTFASPLKNGDVNPPRNAPAGLFSGKYYLYARSNERPAIIDTNKNLLQDSSRIHVQRIYSNCSGPVSIKFSPYYIRNNNNAGISCKLMYLLLLKDNADINALTGVNAQAAAAKVFSKYLH